MMWTLDTFADHYCKLLGLWILELILVSAYWQEPLLTITWTLDTCSDISLQ